MSAPDPARRSRRPRLLSAKAPKGKVAINMLNPDGSIWTRVHLDNRLWEVMAELAERSGKTMDELGNEAFREAINGPGGLAGFMERSEAERQVKAAAARADRRVGILKHGRVEAVHCSASTWPGLPPLPGAYL